MDEHSIKAFEARLRRRRRRVGFFLILALLVVTAGLAAKLFLFRWVVFTDPSMYPSVSQQSTVLAVTHRAPVVGDLVLFRRGDMQLMRRVVAGPGSTVQQTGQGLVVDGQLIPRTPVGSHTYLVYHSGGGSGALTVCNQVLDRINGRDIPLCIDGGDAPQVDMTALARDEVYVRCDNRAYCAERVSTEGIVRLADVEAVGIRLISTRDDSDQPFYKRWFGRFDRLP